MFRWSSWPPISDYRIRSQEQANQGSRPTKEVEYGMSLGPRVPYTPPAQAHMDAKQRVPVLMDPYKEPAKENGEAEAANICRSGA